MPTIENDKNEKTAEKTEKKSASAPAGATDEANKDQKIKTRSGSGYLKQLYSTARTTTATTGSNLNKLTTFMVNFIPVDKVDASELQVRVHFEDSEIEALAHSIKEHGVLQPILVVQDGDRYKVIAGERRLRASKMAGIERIPARVLSTDDKATHEIALRENLDRVDLHPLEEGEGYLSLLEAQLYTSHESISKAFGKPKSRITECIGFTRLPVATKQDLLKRGTKNRSLLRQLLISPPELHLEMIAEAEGKDEVLATTPGGAPATITQTMPDGTVVTAAAPADPTVAVSKTVVKKEVRPFEWVGNSKGFNVPAFKWKSGEGRERLEDYKGALYRLLAQVEERLNVPTP